MTVQGRVQGVGFRVYVARRAHDLGLVGWVRNLPGGAVELEAFGDPEPLAVLRDQVAQGPSGARVTGYHEEWGEGTARGARFEILG